MRKISGFLLALVLNMVVLPLPVQSQDPRKLCDDWGISTSPDQEKEKSAYYKTHCEAYYLKDSPLEEINLSVAEMRDCMCAALCLQRAVERRVLFKNRSNWPSHIEYWKKNQQKKNDVSPEGCTLTRFPSVIKLPASGLADETVTFYITAPGFTGDFKISNSFDVQVVTLKRVKDYVSGPTHKGSITHQVSSKEGVNGINYTVTPNCGASPTVEFRKHQESYVRFYGIKCPAIVKKGDILSWVVGVQGKGAAELILSFKEKIIESRYLPFKEGPSVIKSSLSIDEGGTITASLTPTDPDEKAPPPASCAIIVMPYKSGSGKIECGAAGVTITIPVENPNSGVSIDYAIIGKVEGLESAKGKVSRKQGHGNSIFVPWPESAKPGDSFRVGVKMFYSLTGEKGSYKPFWLKWSDKYFEVPASTQGPLHKKDTSSMAMNLNQESTDFVIEGYCEFCGDEMYGLDRDEDGVGNSEDNCPDEYNPNQDDADTDGIGDICDNCPNHPNADQVDSDEDGLGDVCDLCPDDANPAVFDQDEDGRGDSCDNCPDVYNPDQSDTDSDGLGDACDNCPDVANADQIDNDGNGTGDACQDDLCIPPECCEEFPLACKEDCYEACQDGYKFNYDDCYCYEISDLHPPIVVIQAPQSGSSVPAGATVQLTVLFRDDGELDSGVVSGAFTASGEALAGGPSPGSFSVSPTKELTKQFNIVVKSDLTGVQERTIFITALGTDAKGNQSAVDGVSLIAGGEGYGLLIAVSPSNPGPYEDVTVTVTVTNCLPDSTNIHYTVSGTDKYAQEATLGVNGECQTSFTIPGAKSGVTDTVVVDIVGTGISNTVVYVF